MIRFAKIILPAGLNGLALGLLALSATAALPVAMPVNLPLFFEANQGQANVPAQFIARGHDYEFLISPAEAQIVLCQSGAKSAVVRLQFTGANPQAPIRGDAELPGKINYLTGSNPAQWRTGVPMFARVRVGELYPGVNLVYYGNQQQLEYDFVVAPGANPRAIAMRFDGVDKISINPQGGLILSLAAGEIHQPQPVIYQTRDGVRKEIPGGYRMMDAHTVAFVVGEYDRSQPLVIDPVLAYSTYFGGSAGETAYAVALDAAGNVYLAGQTFSKEFSTNATFSTAGAFQTNYAGGKLTGDAFVFKLDAASGLPAYITYLGGSADDGAFGVAADSAGNAYVTGFTDSTNFPTSTNALYKNISGTFSSSFGSYPIDAFVTELDPEGAHLVYSTYLGGSSMDSGLAIAVDATGSAYVTGYTYSSNFPTAYAWQSKLACSNTFYFNANAFIAKIGPGGSPLVYSTYFGGTNFDVGRGIAVDTNGLVYVTGYTVSTNFPATNAVFQQLVRTNTVGTNQVSVTNFVNGYLLNSSTNKSSASDAFVARFDSTGTNLVYSTLLGSTNNDMADGIAVDNNGDAYVTGWTVSTNFPNTAGLYSFMVTNTSFSFPATNVFLTKITNAIGTTNVGIAWSAVFGGKGVDVGNGVALDPAGNVFVTGSASSTNFPTYNVPGLMSSTNSGKSDAFVIAFSSTNATGTNLLYSGYLGGKDNDYGYGIAVDTNGNAYVVGQTLSTNFPTFNANYPSRNGTNDAFLTKIILTVLPPEIDTNHQPTSQTNVVGSSVTFSAFLTTNDVAPPYFFQWQKDGTNLVDGTNVMDGGSIISGATTNILTIDNARTNDSGNYQIIVTNYGGSAASSIAVLLVTNLPPTITTQPAGQTNGVGTTVTFVVTATGTAPLTYQWKIGGTTNLVNGAHISGVTNATLTINSVQLTNSGDYTVVVTNPGGSVTSSNAHLTVISTPMIVVQPTPANQSLAVGSTATYSVSAIGTIPLSYHWQLNGTNLIDGGSISGSANVTLTVSPVQTNNSGTYSVVVTNVDGSVTSSNVFLLVTNIPPTITMQPTSQTNGVGTTVTFAVAATGTAPLGYQWQLNGTNLVNGTNLINGANVVTKGATTNILTISTVQTNNSGNYTVVVTNPGGSVTSSNAFLTVLSAPVIIVQPAPTNQAMAVGSTATYSVTAIGTIPLSYHWQLNGTNLVNSGVISGATTTNLTISPAQTNNSGTYTVVVTNVDGSVTSSNVFLLVTNIPPTITMQPTSQTNGVGTTVTFAVAATGTAPLGYQWQLNGTNLVNGTNLINGANVVTKGATTNILTISTVQTNNSGNYTVVVTNPGGSVTSSNAFLTVLSAPVIIVQPAPMNQVIAAGSTATYSVTAIGTIPLSYHWQLNGTNLVNSGVISGATTTNLTISPAQTNNSGAYTVVVTNVDGSVTSSNAVLLVTNIPPTITMQPTNQTVVVGATVTLAVTATGTAPLSYQWQLNGTNLVNSGRNGQFSGVTNTMLSIKNSQTNNSGNYTVIVTNPGGSVTSSNAILTVTVAPVIVMQPTNQALAVGETAAFAVTVVGITPLNYQWQLNGTNLVDGTNLDGSQISGATTTDLAIFNAQTNNSATNYTVIVANSAGSVTSSNAVLTVTNSPTIFTLQPSNQTVMVGATVTFTVDGTAQLPFTLQWLKDGTNLVNGGRISGATNATLVITNAQTTDSGTYWIVVANAWGMLASSNAVLTVIVPAPDFGNITAAGGGSFILSGSGGVSNGTYYVLMSSNLLTPVTNWTSIATNQFDSQGNFIFTNSAQTNTPQEFYLLQLP